MALAWRKPVRALGISVRGVANASQSRPENKEPMPAATKGDKHTSRACGMEPDDGFRFDSALPRLSP